MSYLSERRSLVLGSLDPARCRGLEFGPLDNPLVRKNEGDISYIDYASTEVLRRQHANGSSIRPENILDVDYIWGDSPLADTISNFKPFDYVVAAHVIEHVPDVVGWLLEIHSVLVRSGLVGLIIPDRRHTFDFARAESTVGEMMEAHFQRYRRPSMRQVFDHCWSTVDLDKSVSWNCDPSQLELRRFMGDIGLQLAHDQAASLRTEARYFDSHCWVFTPDSFLRCCEALGQLGYFPFIVEHIQATVVDEFEFIVRLRTHDPADRASALQSLKSARERVADDPNEREYARRMRASRARDAN